MHIQLQEKGIQKFQAHSLNLCLIICVIAGWTLKSKRRINFCWEEVMFPWLWAVRSIRRRGLAGRLASWQGNSVIWTYWAPEHVWCHWCGCCLGLAWLRVCAACRKSVIKCQEPTCAVSGKWRSWATLVQKGGPYKAKRIRNATWWGVKNETRAFKEKNKMLFYNANLVQLTLYMIQLWYRQKKVQRKHLNGEPTFSILYATKSVKPRVQRFSLYGPAWTCW